MLSSKQIEIFHEIYKHNSVSVAAERLNISQPSVSKSLKTIENNIGYKLFLRKGKKLLATPEADSLHEYASLVTNQVKNFNYIANTFKSRSADFINIGTTPSIAETIVPKIIKKYKKINPNIRFNLINLNSIDLTEDRYKPDIDITICYNAKQKNNLHNIILKEGGHMLVSAKKYNLGKNVALKDLTSLPYIEITNLLSIYEKSNIMNYLIDSGIKMNFYLKTDSYSSALSIINEGIGIGIIDDNTIENAKLDVVNISNIKDGSFKYRINATMKKGNIREECNQFFNYLAQ